MLRRVRLMAGALAVAGCTASADAVAAWDVQRPDSNAAAAVRLFEQICVAHLGHTERMHAAVRKSGVGMKTTFAGDAAWGPSWSFDHGQVSASDHRHNHDGDECSLELRVPVAPSPDAVMAALRERGLVSGSGEPAEFGATMFQRGDTEIFVRRDVAQEATGIEPSKAGLTLLIKRPAG